MSILGIISGLNNLKDSKGSLIVQNDQSFDSDNESKRISYTKGLSELLLPMNGKVFWGSMWVKLINKYKNNSNSILKIVACNGISFDLQVEEQKSGGFVFKFSLDVNDDNDFSIRFNPKTINGIWHWCLFYIDFENNSNSFLLVNNIPSYAMYELGDGLKKQKQKLSALDTLSTINSVYFFNKSYLYSDTGVSKVWLGCGEHIVEKDKFFNIRLKFVKNINRGFFPARMNNKGYISKNIFPTLYFKFEDTFMEMVNSINPSFIGDDYVVDCEENTIAISG